MQTLCSNTSALGLPATVIIVESDQQQGCNQVGKRIRPGCAKTELVLHARRSQNIGMDNAEEGQNRGGCRP